MDQNPNENVLFFEPRSLGSAYEHGYFKREGTSHKMVYEHIYDICLVLRGSEVPKMESMDAVGRPRYSIYPLAPKLRKKVTAG